MTRLLVSVRSAGEARAALEGGADWIDVKEPARGSLGRADAATIGEIVAEIAGCRPVSLALGELAEYADWANIDWRGITAAKIGLAGAASHRSWTSDWSAAWRQLPSAVTRVAVAYADYQAAHCPSPAEILAGSKENGCTIFLLDTWNKASGDLLSQLSITQLESLIEECRAQGMRIALAGSLAASSLSRVSSLGADIIGVRGAACRGGRSGALDAALVQELVALLRSTPIHV